MPYPPLFLKSSRDQLSGVNIYNHLIPFLYEKLSVSLGVEEDRSGYGVKFLLAYVGLIHISMKGLS